MLRRGVARRTAEIFHTVVWNRATGLSATGPLTRAGKRFESDSRRHSQGQEPCPFRVSRASHIRIGVRNQKRRRCGRHPPPPKGPGSIRNPAKTRSNLAVPLGPGWHRLLSPRTSRQQRRRTSKPSCCRFYFVPPKVVRMLESSSTMTEARMRVPASDPSKLRLTIALQLWPANQVRQDG